MRFCGQCATPLAVSPGSGEERKLVTVLFADVVGSTRLSGRADPERVRAVMARFFDIAREEIGRFGGTIEKFIGDAVMGIFGLPTVHEDDPERAARAAVAIRSRVAPEVEAGHLPEIRVGLYSGEVVADPHAVEKGEFLVTGEAVNLAARLQQHAEPGQILLGERTMVAFRHVAQLRPVQPLMVKGVAEPLPAWELLEVFPPRGREVRATPFVGRREELHILHGFVSRMRREGRGHAVTVLGPAGVGKTRLVQEFLAQTQDVHVLRGRALSYGTGVPFWPLGEAIREECGILFGDSLEVAQRKLQDAAARLEIVSTTPALQQVLGLGGEGRDLPREALFAAMRAFFEGLTHRVPLFLILEDLHSAEDVTLDFVEHAAGSLRDTSMLLLVLSRPELLDRRPAWMGGKRNATTLFLDPLAGAESRALVRGILGDKLAPESLVDLVLERGGGNPLFVEEMLSGLVERGVLTQEASRWVLTVPLTQVAIPDSVHAVISARIDALPADEKQALQAAALAGNDFWLGAVRFIAGEDNVDKAISALVGKELLIHKRRSTLLDEQQFTFRNILIRDVTYATIPKSQRWLRHARCAEWYQKIAGDRQAEFADFIAHHWLQVIVLRQDLGLPPDSRAREQAILNLLLAGDRAARLYANATAIDHYTRTLDLQPSPPERLRALLGRGEVWMLLGQHERAREDFAPARHLAQGTGERRWEAIALDRVGHSYRRQDQIVHALEDLETALALSREVGDPSLTGRILNHVGFTYFNVAKHEEAIRSHHEAQRLLERCGDLEGLAESLHGLGENAMLLGRFQEGIQWFSESTKICDQLGNRSLAAENDYMISSSQHALGDYGDAQAHAERSVAALSEIGDVWNSSFALGRASRICTTLGHFDKALDYATRGLALARQINAGRPVMSNLWSLNGIHRELEDFHGAWQADREWADLARTGEVGAFLMPARLSALAFDSAALGRMDEAMAHVQEARRALGEGQTRMDFPEEATHVEGRVFLVLGQAARALDSARRLFQMVVANGTLHWRVPALLLSADATASLGELVTAASTYRAAAEEAERSGRAPALWRALAGLAETQRALAHAQEATASAGRAREIIDRLAAAVPDERLRATFLQSAKVQRVLALAGT